MALPDIKESNETFRDLTNALNRSRQLLQLYREELKSDDFHSSDSQVDMDSGELDLFLEDMDGLFEDMHDKWPSLWGNLEIMHRHEARKADPKTVEAEAEAVSKDDSKAE